MREWIPVEGRLPENGVQVVIYLSVTGTIQMSSIQERNITMANQEIIKIKVWEGASNEQVTHWTPIPDKIVLKRIQD